VLLVPLSLAIVEPLRPHAFAAPANLAGRLANPNFADKAPPRWWPSDGRIWPRPKPRHNWPSDGWPIWAEAPTMECCRDRQWLELVCGSLVAPAQQRQRRGAAT